jgi:Rrf2 family iron-sulfur cluster assembly transcriptional regulator
MKISTKGDYATRALLALALRDGPASVRDIAETTGLPQAYLEQIMLAMKSSGLVEAKRGVQGGYSLARPAQEISLKEIVEAAEGNVAPLGCAAIEPDTSCIEEGECALQLVWIKVRGAVSDILDAVTLEDVAEETRKIKSARRRSKSPLVLTPASGSTV